MALTKKEIKDLSKQYLDKKSFSESLKLVMIQLNLTIKNHPEKAEECKKLKVILAAMVKKNMSGGRK